MKKNKIVFNEEMKKSINKVIYLFIALTLLRFIAEVVPPLWFLLLIAYTVSPLFIVSKENYKDIGIQQPMDKRYLFIGIISAIGVKAVTIAFLFICFGNTQPNWMMNIVQHYREMPSLPTVAIIFTMVFSIGIPLAEELFFRMFQSVWRTIHTVYSAIIISAALFGLSHIDQYIFDFNFAGILLRFIPITLYGLVHAWVYHKTKSVFSSMITHIAGNTFEALVFVFIIIPRI